jgi:hypothetical protein
MLASRIKQLQRVLALKERALLCCPEDMEMDLCVDQLQGAVLDLILLNGEIQRKMVRLEEVALGQVCKRHPSVSHLIIDPELARITQ